MSALRSDALLAWAMLRGSPRSERWRLALTALGAALGTCFALAAAVVAVIGTRYGSGPPRYTNGLLNEGGLRPGVITALLLLIVPVLAFVGQCTRIGAVQRERRFAALRLAGATPRQVRRIGALETAAACGLGSLAGMTGFLVLRAVLHAGQRAGGGGDGPQQRALTWPTDVPVPWAAFLAVVLGLPLLATLEAWFTLRRAATDPLGAAVRRRRPRRFRRVGMLPGPLALLAATGLVLMAMSRDIGPDTPFFPATGLALPLYLFGLLTSSAGMAAAMGRLASRSGRPALMIAGKRLRADPWAASRAHTAVMLAALIGVGYLTVRRVALGALRADPDNDTDYLAFYIGGYDLAGLALLIGVAVTISGLAVSVAESLTARRRTLAALAAAGTPRKVLRRAVLLETALPLAPAIALSVACGLAITVPFLAAGAWSARPLLEAVLIAGGLLAASLLATAASLPLLRYSVHPAQLRYE
ncbi:ABC transporter permease [Actinacidiphila glaucinigra]|uniref:FtsX-like permease family protein n=1 Tax=Actinacidiphila glaucinigra TaxID=235986 RepID=UPI00324D2133